MNEKYNMKSIVAGLVLVIVGIVCILLDIFLWNTTRSIWISIGCSLLASGLVILVQAWLVDAKNIDFLEEWGIEKIYKTRADKNADSDRNLGKLQYRLDVVAFGLKSFRNFHKKDIVQLLERGVPIRILTMDPSDENRFLKQREREEEEPEGQIKKSINDLVAWADDLNNSRNNKSRIEIKGYKCMTLDFYWRMDDEMYIGPYWYGIDSQQTITYKFISGKKGFGLYSDYFDKLWANNENNVLLTKQVDHE